MGFREVLQQQLELLSRVLNKQHELELERLKSEGSTYRSENSGQNQPIEVDHVHSDGLKAGKDNNCRIQKICDVELKPSHMLRDGHRNEHAALQMEEVEEIQSFEPDRSEFKTEMRVESLDIADSSGDSLLQCEPPPALPEVNRTLPPGTAPLLPYAGAMSETENSLANAEDTILKMKKDAMRKQAEIAELQEELEEARDEIQALNGMSNGAAAKPVNGHRQSRFGILPAPGNRRATRMSLAIQSATRPESALSALSGRRNNQTIQFDPSVSEEHVIREESIRESYSEAAADARKSQGFRTSLANGLRPATSGRASPQTPRGKRSQAFAEKKNRNLSIATTTGVAFGPEFSAKKVSNGNAGTLSSSRSLNNRSRKVTALVGLSVMPEMTFSGQRSNGEYESEMTGISTMTASMTDSTVITNEDDLAGYLTAGAPTPHRLSGSAPNSARSSLVHQSEEAEFEVLPGWGTPAKQQLARSMTRGTADGVNKTLSGKTKQGTTLGLGDVATEALDVDQRSFCSRLVLHPKSPYRLSWDVAGISFTTYDAFVIPLAFLDLTENAFTISMSWITRLFWTFDIWFSCMTGFNTENGDLEMRILPIVRKYLRTWFIFDALLVFADWLQELLTEGLSTAGRMGRGGKIARIARILRLVRLLRAARLKYVLASWFENMAVSEQLAIVSSITMAMFGILCAIHLIGCLWYAIGVSSNQNWAIALGVSEEAFWSRYAVSLFWATGQFTGGVDPEPLNDTERVFVVLVMIFAFLIATCFVSSFTSSLTQFHIISSHQAAQFQILKRYMMQHRISHKLSIRVNRNAKHVFSEKQRKTPEEDVELLKLVSEPLRVEMHFEMYFPTLALHPLFQRYSEEMQHSMRKVCHHALCLLSFSAGDILFSTGEEPAARDMLFIVDGEFDYLHTCFVTSSSQTSSSERQSVCTLDDDRGGGGELVLQESQVVSGHWVCEPVIWTSGWLYCGTLRATYDSQVLVLDGVTFMELASKTHNPCFDLANYAKEYVNQLKKLSSRASDLGTAVDSRALVTQCYGRRAIERSMKQKSVIKQMIGSVPNN